MQNTSITVPFIYSTFYNLTKGKDRYVFRPQSRFFCEKFLTAFAKNNHRGCMTVLRFERFNDTQQTLQHVALLKNVLYRNCFSTNFENFLDELFCRIPNE